MIHRLFRTIFDGLETRYAKELAVVREQYPSEPVRFTEEPLIIHWPEAMKMLQDAGHQVLSLLISKLKRIIFNEGVVICPTKP